ncbi:hypothetical protein BH23BAC4_BH23BAC4_09280 [soil metagenome]
MPLRLSLFFLSITLAVSACDRSEQRAQQVVDRAINVHGGDAFERSTVSFVFRGDMFEIRNSPAGDWHVIQTTVDSLGTLRYVLHAQGVRAERDGEQVTLSAEESHALETTLNSVSYFALLPYRLNDPAAQKRHVRVDTIRAIEYDLVEVTFDQEGGGRDWEDRFLYWFARDFGTLDFMAYEFQTGDGGTRFRAATNPRRVGPLLITDHVNYTADREGQRARLEEYAHLYEHGAVEYVSNVNLAEVQVRASD